MSRFLPKILGIVVLFYVSCAMAQASRILNQDETARFIESFELTQKFANELKAQEKTDFLKLQPKNVLNKSFGLHSGNVEILKEKYPEDYEQLGRIVSIYKFETVEEWALVGDAVMAAYYSVKSPSTNTMKADMQKQLTPELLATLPPTARAEFEKAFDLADALHDVPQENRVIVTPYLKVLDVIMLKAEGKLPSK